MVGFDVRDVSTWPLYRVEMIGQTAKNWLTDPSDGTHWLYKPDMSHTTQAGARWVEREGFSEKLACELASTVGIPHANVELAVHDGVSGCISLDLKPDGWELQVGAVLLSGLLPDYMPGYVPRNKTRSGHSLTTIRVALEGVGPPPGSVPPCDAMSAFEVFVGYLVLDALIANRDRHDENWAVMRPAVGDGTSPLLAGAFDHGRALAAGAKESKLAQHVATPGAIAEWAVKGTAWRFEHEPGVIPTLVQVAKQGLELVSPQVKSHWLAAIDSLDETYVTDLTARVAGMSDVRATFINEVIRINRRRVLDEC